MPIDPSILRPEPFTPTFRTPGQFEAERAQRDVLRARAGEELAQVQRDQQLRAVLQKHGGNLEAAAGEIAAIDPELGQRVFASVTGRQQQARVAQTAEQAAREKAQADFHGRVSRIFARDVPDAARASYYGTFQREAQAKGYSLPESMDEARVLLTPAPKEPEAYTLGPGQARYKGGEVVAQVPAAERVEPREPSPTEASLAVAAAKGDKSAAQALAIIRGQRERAGGTDNEPLQAIIGQDGKPVLVRRSQAEGKTPASTREQGRAVTSGDAGRIADLDTSLNDLSTLTKTIPAGSTGVRAKAGASVPNFITEWTGVGATAKSKQAVIDRVKQVIGKALEGGVLRKEDEAKYEKILPTIGDVDSVVASKLKGLESAIRQRRQTSLEALEDAGYDTARFNARKPAGGDTKADPLGIR